MKQLGVIIMIIIIIWKCDGCFEDERLAVLQLKSSFSTSSSISSFHSWGITNDNCCKWQGVECSSSTGRLTHLFIRGNYWEREWNFSASLFFSFKQLTTLSLQFIFIGGSIQNQGFDRLSTLENLVCLDLSRNTFRDNNILSSIGKISSLKSLSLVDIGLNSTTRTQGFFNLTNLEYLDLSYNDLDNNILKDIGKLISLKTLLLLGCGLSNTLPSTEGLCNLRNLEKLDLSFNELSGTLPWCIANLTSLREFGLSDNHFNGSISPLGSFTSLQKLEIWSNQFKVPLSLEPFFNNSKLKYLNGEDNYIIYEDHAKVHDSTPSFQLERLWLSSHGNVTGAGFPKFLWNQHDLQELDLSNIQLKGEFPHWLLENNTNLVSLTLANTSLLGPLHLSSHSHKNLQYLDISNNDLNGTMPIEIGQVLPNMHILNLSGNGLIGSMPSSFVKMRMLESLDLSSNKLSGEIPQDMGIGSSLLYKLVLSDNDFEGPILPSTVYWKELHELRVDNNNFSGNISYSLLNCTELQVFDASNNHHSGRIPGWIANVSSLEVLDLSENRFSGSLPTQLGPSWITEVYLTENMLQGSLVNSFYNCSEMTTLDLSHNYFSGTIPNWIGKLPMLRYILMSHNNLEGEIPIEVCSLEHLSLIDLSNNNLSGHLLSCIRVASKYIQADTYFVSAPAHMEQPLVFTTKGIPYPFRGSILEYISGIDLSCNNLSGKIPPEIGNLIIIQVLNLSYNSLIGPIPESFSNLAQIESLDLSYNNLDGKIPSQLLGLNFLSRFSVAHNNLSGRTPEMIKQFATFDNTSYEGNPFLCGLPLTKSCSPIVPPPSPNAEEEEDGFMDMEAFYVSCVISYIIVLFTIGAILYVNPYWRRRWFYMIEVRLANCYYFMEDHVFTLFKFKAS